MDDLYAINTAKTEFGECFNLGDISKILGIVDPDLVSFNDGAPSEFGESGLNVLKIRLANLFELFTVKLVIVVIEIRLQETLLTITAGMTLRSRPSMAVKRYIAGIAMWTSGEKTKKVSGNYGCTSIIKTSRMPCRKANLVARRTRW